MYSVHPKQLGQIWSLIKPSTFILALHTPAGPLTENPQLSTVILSAQTPTMVNSCFSILMLMLMYNLTSKWWFYFMARQLY